MESIASVQGSDMPGSRSTTRSNDRTIARVAESTSRKRSVTPLAARVPVLAAVADTSKVPPIGTREVERAKLPPSLATPSTLNVRDAVPRRRVPCRAMIVDV